MSRHDRYRMPGDAEFERVVTRYIVEPGAIWVAAILVALLSALN